MPTTPADEASSSYPLTDRNRAKRRAERANYDKETVHAILDAALVCHIAYVIDGQPYCTPITFWRRDDYLYWHGSTMNRMLRHQQQQADVCVTVTHLDGLVLTRSAYGHSVNYRAVMAFGRASLIEDQEEKRRAVDGLLDKFFPGRSGIAHPPTQAELRSVSIMKMKIEQASAKIRNLPASEEPAEYLDLPVWAGIIPVSMRVGAAEKCDKLVPGVAPGPDLDEYVAGRRLDEVLMEGQRKLASAG